MSGPMFLMGPKGSFIIFDYIVSILAIFGNSLILESVLKVQFDLTGYRRFLISLAISDLYICFVNVMTFIHSAVIMYSPDPELQKCGSDILRSMQFTGFFANLLNLCGMSVDHFIGIVYPLRYCDFMSPKIARMAVVSIWIVSFVIGFADYPISLGLYLTRTSDQAYLPNTNMNEAESNLVITSIMPPTGGSIYGSGDDLAFFDTEEPSFSPLTTTEGSGAGLQRPANFLSSQNETQGGAGMGPNLSADNLDIMSDDIDAILSSIVGGSFPAAKFGISVNSSTKDRLQNILNLVAQPKKEAPGWCTILHPTRGWLEFSVMTMTLLCFFFLSICYGRIFKEVFGNVDPTERNTRKLVVTTFILLGAFTICWMPFMVFEFIMIITFYANSSAPGKAMTSSASLFIVHNAFNSMLICAPLIDPLIYSVRMRVIRRYILLRYKKLLPCCRDYIEKSLVRRPTFGIAAIPSRLSNGTSLDKGTLKPASSRQFVEMNGDREKSTSPKVKTKLNGSLTGIDNPKDGNDHHVLNVPLLELDQLNDGKQQKQPAAVLSSPGRPPAIYGNRFKKHMKDQAEKAKLNNNQLDVPLAKDRRRTSSLDCVTCDTATAPFQTGLALKAYKSEAPSPSRRVSEVTLRQSNSRQFFSFNEHDSNPESIANLCKSTQSILKASLTTHSGTTLEPHQEQETPSSPNVTIIYEPSLATSLPHLPSLDKLSQILRRGSIAMIDDSSMASSNATTRVFESPEQKPLLDNHNNNNNDSKSRIYVDDGVGTDDLPVFCEVAPVVKPPTTIAFDSSDQVYRKFRGNAQRLLDLGNSPTNHAIALARLARQHNNNGSSSASKQSNEAAKTDLLPRKHLINRVLMGKSPTQGDLSGLPADDLFIVTTDC